jgi:cytochrome c556
MNNVKQSPRMTVMALFCATALAACSSGAKGESSAVAAQPTPAAPKPAVTAPAAGTAPAGPVAVATLKELMDSTVDPAADGIWEAVAVRSSRKGVEHHQPRTPEEWAALRRHAVTLIEAMNLVVMPGRQAAPAGTKPGLGELEPAQIEQGIAQKQALFVTFAKALQGTAREALTAIDQKDIDGIVKTGGDIDAACEVCHVTFWYPNQH